MEKNNFIKHMLVVGIIFFLTSTCFVQGRIESSTQTIENQPFGYEDVMPYLQVELAGETKTFTPTDDTYIANYDPSEVNGDLIVLATRNRYGAGGSDIWECDILVKFDLSSIPPSTPVLSASLNLYYYDYGNTNPAGRPLTVYQVKSDWDEMSVNFNTQPLKETTVSQTENVPGAPGVWMSWELTEDVQEYVDAPGSNFGWEIMDETYWGYYEVPAAYFYSKEYIPPGPPFIPYLEVVLPSETKTFTPTDDTYIANYDPSEINGDLIVLATRNRYGSGGSSNWECDVLVKFDLSSIPPSTPVLSASLNLYYYDYGNTNPAGRPLTVYQVTSDWDEMSVNFNTQPSKATTMSASVNVPGSTGVGMSWDLTQDVQEYIDNPGVNFGWEIMDETYWGYYEVPAAFFYSKEYIPPGPPFVPYLEVVLASETKTFTPVDDTYIANYDPSEINGDLDILATRNMHGAGSDIWECDILIKFDTSMIPPSTPVLSASLNLYYSGYGSTDPAGRPLTVYKLTSNWHELSVNYNTKPSKASTMSASENVPGSAGVGMNWDLTEDVQAFVDTPGTNFGWEIMDESYWGYYDVPTAFFKSNGTCGGAENEPPETPQITGPAQGTTGVTYGFNFTTCDPNGDDVYYYIDWGDNTSTAWIGPFSSDLEITRTHTYSEQGTYTVRAKAKDIYDAESDWGTMSVIMPTEYTFSFLRILHDFLDTYPNLFPLLQRLLDH